MDRPVIKARDLTAGDRLWWGGREVKPVKLYKSMPGRFSGVSAVQFSWPAADGAGLEEVTVGPEFPLQLAVST